uniref:Nucleoporin GLE1 n=1 Tax=Caenorhabditis tropicalis TaxID=1561998 RepID=A0A1I7UFP0_9PELO
MDVEPPEKKVKGLSRMNENSDADHQNVLSQFGISSSFDTSGLVFKEIPNSVVLSLIYFQRQMKDIIRTTKSLLGMPTEEVTKDCNKEYHRFRRKVMDIEEESKKEKKRGKDKYLNFLKSLAFDRSFFFSENNGHAVSISPKTPVVKRGHVKGSAKESVLQLRDIEVQTDLPCDIDFTNPALTPFSVQKLHQKCISHCSQISETFRKRINKVGHWQKYHKNRILKSNLSIKLLKKANILNEKTQQILKEKNSQLAAVKNALREKDEVFQSALAKLDNVSNVVELKEGKSFSNRAFEAVIRLKSLGVADEKVGDVMRVVGDLVGVTFDFLPSASTCRNFALSALHLGQSHIKSRLDNFLESNDSLCLASDETTKGTAKLQAFGIHTPDGGFTLLGVQPVAEKSAQTAFNALEHLVGALPVVPSDFFKKFLVKVTSTMCDSARTEKKFNEIVEKARKEAVPEIVNDYDKLSEAEKSNFSQFSQFFCQLHVVANYTDVALNALLGHESLVTGKNKLGEASVFGLIKMVSQLFGQRGSGLHGILQLWEAWCGDHLVNRFTFPAFSGNRFNIVFVLASRVFFHRFHLIEFAKECDCSKVPLQEMRKLLENEMIIDHLQILGLCDQLITGPLWRLAEGCEHILDTCKYSKQLQKWLKDCATIPECFFDGSSPTPSLQVSSPTNSTLLFEALLRRDPTESTSEVASVVCNSSLLYFNRAFVDFLPGGKHCNDQNEIRKSMEAAPATNRNIESVFASSQSKPLPLQDLIGKLEKLIDDQQLSQQLLLVDHEFVGKRIKLKISSKRSRKGFVEDIRINGAKRTIRVQFDDKSDDKTESIEMGFDEFEAKVASGVVVFDS